MVLEPSSERGMNSRIAKMVKLIGRFGPDIDRVSRISGDYKETTRYWFHEKIIKPGMVIQAVPNEGALGLRRVSARVRVAEPFLPHVRQALWTMNDLAYAAAYELAIPDEEYVVHAAVPHQFVGEYKSFMLGLQQLGIFESVQLYEFEWFRRVPMRSEFYDFNAGRWDYDWQTPIPLEPDDMATNTSKQAKFDQTDLLILKELQLDANRSLLEIRDAIRTKNNIELHYKTLGWHYRQHVVGRRLFTGYSTRWLGTRYNQAAEKAEQRRHRYLVMDLLVKNVGDAELLDLSARMHQTPFLWSEMGGGDYFAQCAYPIENTIEAFEQFRGVMRQFGERAHHYIVDQKNAIMFLLPFSLWSPTERRWTFERKAALERFESLVLEVRNGVR
jgi:hypothetical protein